MSDTLRSTPLSIQLLTMSFRGDFELCQLLCSTADRFVPEEFEHIVAVPKSDMALFRPLANHRRRLIAQEDLLPAWLHKVPLPSPKIRRLLRMPRRNVYVTRRAHFVRGWIAQQMMKIAATARSSSDVTLHVDSDVAFVRPLDRNLIVRDRRVRLLRRPGDGDTPMHHAWHRAASSLLGVRKANYFGADFVDVMNVWRRDVVAAMLARIADVKKADAFGVLAKTPHFSEYILYGVFCTEVTGIDAAGHFETDRSLCATLWSDVDESAISQRLATVALADEEIAVGIQSTHPLDFAERLRVVERLTKTRFASA